MSLVALFATAFVIGLSGAAMPGPLLTVTITESLGRGWRAALWLVTGHGLLELVLVLLLAGGLGRVVGHPGVVRTMAVAGGGVLAWLAFGAFRTARHPPSHLVPTADAPTVPTAPPAPREAPAAALRLVVTGAAVSLANPYWLVWWATIGVTYVLEALRRGAAGLPAFYLGHVLSDYVWYLLVGLAFATGRRWLRPAVLRAVFCACGTVLAGFGLLFVLAGLGLLNDYVTPGVAPAASGSVVLP